MKKRNRLIMGSAIGLAMIATAIDHTRHRVPKAEADSEQVNYIIEGEEDKSNASPCSMTVDDANVSPCSL